MTKRADIIRAQSKRLLEAEAQIERALISVAELTSSLAQGRIDAKVSMVVGTEAMEELISTMTVLGAARTKIARTHGHLSDIASLMGYPLTLGGSETDKFPGRGAGFQVVEVANDSQQVG